MDLGAEQLWGRLHDPVVLQHCIKGCHSVEKLSDNRYQATFKIKLGPLKKTFNADLQVVDPKPPERYQLLSSMQSSFAGNVNGIAEVSLNAISANSTNLIYTARVRASGWIGELGARMLSGTAEKYMNEFFSRLVEEHD